MNDTSEVPDRPWAIVSVKGTDPPCIDWFVLKHSCLGELKTGQNESFETPMQPITMMRNALGTAEGGSGVPLDRAAYTASVAYWEKHATIS